MKKIVNGVVVELSSEEEAAFLSAQATLQLTAAQAIKQQIEALEQASPITARGQRELTLVIRELVKAITGSYPTGPGFQKAAELEAAIAALRAQL